MSDIVKQMVSNALWGGSSGGGLPTGGEPHQMLVTDKDGTATWQEQLCYAEEKEHIFVPEVELVKEHDMFFIVTPVIDRFVAGREYIVTYNNVDYVCKAEELVDFYNEEEHVSWLFGNLHAMNPELAPEESSEPFYMYVLPASSIAPGSIDLYALDNAEAVTISIRGMRNTVKPLDAKYAPGYMFGEYPYRDRVYLKETVIENITGDGATFTLDRPFDVYQRYTVIYNGLAHYGLAFEIYDQGTRLKGMGLYAESSNGESYLEISVQPDAPTEATLVVGDDAASCTLSITGYGTDTVKVPGKLIEDKAMPFIVTVELNGDKVMSVEPATEDVYRALNNNRAVFCWVVDEDENKPNYMLPLHEYKASEGLIVFRTAGWADYDGVDNDGITEIVIKQYAPTTVKKLKPGLGGLQIYNDGGLVLTSPGGDHYRIKVSNDGTLSATKV